MSKVYLVMGTTGEYSDRTEWPVKAFISQAKAEELVKNADAAARECKAWTSPSGYEWDYAQFTEENQGRPKNDYDPNMRIDYTGTVYYIIEAELDVWP